MSPTPRTSTPANQRILVLGMHRSGTSLLSGLLRTSGVWFGHEDDLVPPNEENPRGFHEHRVLRRLNDGLLHRFGCDWAEISEFPQDMVDEARLGEFPRQAKSLVETLAAQAGDGPIALKDPRLCLLAPYWLPALGDRTLAVLVHRNPEEIARSLWTRNRIPHEVALFLTEHYLANAMHSVAAESLLVTSYSALMERPLEELSRIDAALRSRGAAGLRIDSAAVMELVDQGLYRSRARPTAGQDRHPVFGLHAALGRHQLPQLPWQPAPADAAVHAFEHRTRFEQWARLNHQFRELEAKYIALTRPEEAVDWFQDWNAKGISESGLRSQAHASHLDAGFLRDMLAFHISLRQQWKSQSGPLAGAADASNDQVLEALAGLQSRLDALEPAFTENSSQGRRIKELLARNFDLDERQAVLQQELKQLRGLVEPLREELQLSLRNSAAQLNALEAASSQLGDTAERLARIEQDAAKLTGTLRQIRQSRTWKLLQWPMRLVMSPQTLGRGRTSLDTLGQQTAALEQSHGLALHSGEVPRLKRSRPVKGEQRERPVSIIVLNRDGAGLLEQMFSSYLVHHSPDAAEWVIVDHGSRDSSRAVVTRYMERLPISMLEFRHNHSFASSNNLAARYARGRYLVFCNNDIIFDQPVLDHFIDDLAQPGVGISGARLYYPDSGKRRSDRLQHAGIAFAHDAQYGFPRPYNVQAVAAPPGGLQPAPAVTAALMACRATDFAAVGGFHEEYDYGYEDVDFSINVTTRLGKQVVVSRDAAAIHDESHSQRAQDRAELSRRRLGNIEVFRRRCAEWVYLHLEVEGAPEPGPGARFRIGIVVTDDNPATTAGDFFTASELAGALESELGWTCRFLAERSRTHDWYDCTGLDAILVLLDGYDPRKIRNAKPGLRRIAWLRNWFDRWVKRPWFSTYDVALASSELARDFVATRTGVRSEVLRIATNPKRFHPDNPERSELRSDYCFTGSYWKAPREIEQFDPRELQWSFGLYGAGWQDHEQFAASWRGAIPYSGIPDVYASSSLLIDDANHVTKPWASVNSRVFDALAAGTLVVSNGKRGADETFEGLLPTWSSPAELATRVDYFLGHPKERQRLVQQLRSMVLEKHTYAHRARQLGHVVQALDDRPRIAIKLPVPGWEVIEEWGDFHFGAALARSLARLGYQARLDILPEWDAPRCERDDVVIVLRGLSRYEPRGRQLNLMWNISHPDKVSDGEYESFDHVFVASASHAGALGRRLSVPVSTLLQCTDPHRFHWLDEVDINEHVVFIGNSRKMPRPVVMEAIRSGLDLQVYGTNWEPLIGSRYIRGEHLPNELLGQCYAQAGVVLNDHWETMRSHGFVSNRLFDATACGARVVSDTVESVAELFDALVYQCAPDWSDLADKVSSALSEGPETWEQRRKLADKVARLHSFDARAREIHRVIGMLRSNLAERAAGMAA